MWEATYNYVTTNTNIDRKKYWLHWERYASIAQINPFLDTSVPPLERDISARVFAARVRTGKCGRGNQIKVSGVSDELVDISNTIDMAGKPSQLY